ncbi:hypothetical protein Zmor_018016 [Zophobas morio]|uniref:NADP-dependent oxidoreductase domain-containing protein n=1 Tax=Zophobas morio TaxID=2755281 RepID=A0AA38IAA3_9CUCU|nr:hypothetical protein Zmor_018016 [Zophobas morio]
MFLLNGSKLPSIGFGTNTGVPTEKDGELEKIIDSAIETGYRHIDTALVYRNEKIIGNTLQKWFKSGKLKREEIFITTKLPIFGVHPTRVDYCIKQSLSNLQVECIDLYLVHFPLGCKFHESTVFERNENGDVVMEGPTDHSAIWKKMEEQVDLGRVRYIGLSNYTIPQISIVIKSARIKPACLQVEIHPYLQQPDLVEFCHKNEITVVGFSPLGAPDYNSRMRTYVSDYKDQQLPDMLGNEVIQCIAKKHSKSVAQIILRFLVQNGVVPIPKSRNPQRMRENFNVFHFVLDEDDVNILRTLEVGEEARTSTFRNFMKGIEKHPDYPF